MRKDGKHHLFVEVDNLRLTFIPAKHRPDAKNWADSDVIRINAYRDATKTTLHRGAEIPVPSTAALSELVAGLCSVFLEAKRRCEGAADSEAT